MIEEESQLDETQESDDLFVHQRIVIDKKQAPVRIDKFLMDRLEHVSRNKVQEAIRQGAVRVDDKEVKPNFKIKPQQVVTLVLPSAPQDESVILAEDLPLDILYEDEDLIVLDKAAGMVVHPGVGNHSGTLVNALAWHLHPDKSALAANPYTDRPGLVHRIDKDTSGVMVVPKSDLAATHLAKQFFDHTIERTYLALVWGQPEQQSGRIEGHIGRHPKNRLWMTVYAEGDQGKAAVTHYDTVEPLYYVSLVRCRLETGRTHQIRVHMKYIGHTLFNDERYGGNEILKGTIFTKYRQFVQNCLKLMPRQALHARSLGFTHPRTGERLFFESELPKDFHAVLEKWRSYLQIRKNALEDGE